MQDGEEGFMVRRAISLSVVCLAVAMLVAVPARADWLDGAFDDDIAESGSPAITLGADGVLLVLPVATLLKAHSAGITTAGAVAQLVQRYGPKCSDILDLNRPHRHLKVQLFLSSPVELEDSPERVQGEILDTLKTAKTKPLPRVDNLFVPADEATELFIDYVPTRQVDCVQPGTDDS
jgi:hypothetical protein